MTANFRINQLQNNQALKCEHNNKTIEIILLLNKC